MELWKSRFKLRRPGEIGADTQTEEGFATINDTLLQDSY